MSGRKALRRGKLSKSLAITSVLGGFTHSRNKLSIPPTPQIKVIKAVSEPKVLYYTSVDVVRSIAGKQAVGYVGYFKQFDLQSIYQNAGTVTGVAGGLYGFLGNSINTVNIANGDPIQTNTGIVPYRLVLDSLISEQQYTNASSFPVEMEIFDVVLKRDLPTNNAITMYYGGTPANFAPAPNPAEFWDVGLAMANGDGGGATKYNTVWGSTPFDSELFRDYFKVLKRTTIALAQGSCHSHHIALQPNKLVDANDCQNTDLAGIRGLTMFSLIVVRGTPSYNTATDDRTATGIPAVRSVTTYRYKYHIMGDGGNTVTYTQLAGSLIPTAQAQEQIQPATGDPKTQTTS